MFLLFVCGAAWGAAWGAEGGAAVQWGLRFVCGAEGGAERCDAVQLGDGYMFSC